MSEERRLYDLKYKSPRVSTMTEADLSLHTKGLLLKIHMITGWTVPEGAFLNILIDQFTKKLIEDYGNLNVDEIEFAFRSGGTVVKDWGKAMNLSLLDGVLIPFIAKRAEVSAIEERVTPPLPELPPIPVSDEEFIATVYSCYLWENKDMRIIPELAYKILEPLLDLTIEKKQKIKNKITEQFNVSGEPLKLLCKQYAVAIYFKKQYSKH